MKFTDRLRSEVDQHGVADPDLKIAADIIDEMESAIREMITSPTHETYMMPSIVSVYKGASALAKLEKLNRD